MGKSFRFLFQFTGWNVLAILAFAVIVIAGTIATGGGEADNLFVTYFRTFPFVAQWILYIFAFALCTSNLNLAVSFGARRRDFFWALQGTLLLYTATCWVLQAVITAMPGLLRWGNQEEWELLFNLGGGDSIWLYPLLCLCVLALGCLSGLVFGRSKAMGALVIFVSFLVFFAGMILMMVGIPAGEAIADPSSGLSGTLIALWGNLPLLLTLGLLIVLAVCEAIIYRTVSRFTVR